MLHFIRTHCPSAPREAAVKEWKTTKFLQPETRACTTVCLDNFTPFRATIKIWCQTAFESPRILDGLSGRDGHSHCYEKMMIYHKNPQAKSNLFTC